MRTICVTSLLLFYFSFLSVAQDFDSVQIETRKLTESIYMLEGSGGNIGVCIGEDGTFIIDDQFAPLTEKIRTAITKISTKPIQFVINTHYHHDHTGGNDNFGKSGSIIISHDNAREEIKADEFKRMEESGEEEFPMKMLPIVTFSKTMTLHYNGETINIFHVDNAHTDGDIIIHFIDANVFHMGDVFVRYGFPYIDMAHGGSIDGMIAALEKVIMMANENTKFIPGHGELGTKDDVVKFCNWLKELRSRVKKEMAAGKSKEEITELNPIKDLVTSDADIKGIVNTIYEGIRQK